MRRSRRGRCDANVVGDTTSTSDKYRSLSIGSQKKKEIGISERRNDAKRDIVGEAFSVFFHKKEGEEYVA